MKRQSQRIINQDYLLKQQRRYVFGETKNDM